MINRLRAIFTPGLYHGRGRSRHYFEGWYFKVLNASCDRAYAFIPGVAMDSDGARHSFIQVLDGKAGRAFYHRFSFEEFYSHPSKFFITISGNSFSNDGLILDLPGVSGTLRFSEMVPWPWKWYSPGIMGPYTFAPFMECYHGILSMDHLLVGTLIIEGAEIDFTGGRGYTEKDWGHSFPEAYFWMQTNHFSSEGVSFKASVAKIPWLRSSFTGFIAGLWLGERLYRFTTYNSAILERSFADRNRVFLQFASRDYRLSVTAFRHNATELASPVRGLMDGRISESMSSEIDVKLHDLKTGQLIFSDRGRNAGLEVSGPVEMLFTGGEGE
jgi:hypothetical protein